MLFRARILPRAFEASILILVLFLAVGSEAKEFDFLDEPVSLRTYTGLSSASQGGTLPIAVVLDINYPWHINANQLKSEYLIPTTITTTPPEGIEIRKIFYPKAVEKHLSFSDEPLALYEGEVVLGILIAVASDFPPGESRINATVTYQACDNEKCIAPVDKEIAIPFRVSTPDEAVDVVHTEIFSKIDFGAELTSTSPSGDDGAESGAFSQIIARRGMFLAFLAVFLGGLALNLTPCVYPMIPITIGYFGGQSKGKTSGTVLLAFLYLLGMAVMYSALGLFASLTGSLFGSALQNPFVLVFIALVLIGLSLSMFGMYEIRIPARLSNVAGTSKQGALGAFLMGLTVGIVAAPCIGPFVLGLLTFVGESGNPLLGFSLFFTLAVGLGLPFVFLAILSGNISRLPKSGEWMEWVRKLFGVILLAMAVYFLRSLMPGWLYRLLIGLSLVGSGFALGFLIKTVSSGMFFRQIKRLIGIAAIFLGLYIMLSHPAILGTAEAEGIEWQVYSTEALEEAKSERSYILIDFAADWCIPCKELDHKTFSRKEVIEATKDFVNLKADLTQSSSESTIQLRSVYKIRGVPTVVFIDKNGNERKDLRIVGFVDKNEFLSRLERFTSGGS